MRVSWLVLPAVIVAVNAAHPTLISRHRGDHPSPPLARQAHAPRALFDLLGLGSVLGPILFDGKVDLCLCLKDLDLYLDTNAQARAFSRILGRSTVSALISALVNTSPESQHCSFPPHSHHICKTSEPCYFDCGPGYSRTGDTCACIAPNTVCNGICGTFPYGCPSAVPLQPKPQFSSITTLPQAKRVCRPNETVCGTPDDDYGIGFQCVDTDVTSEQCGGCHIPPEFPTSEEVQPSGKDCHQIPHAIKAGCSGGDCVVYACEAGWTPSPGGDSCVEQSNRKLLRKRNRSSTAVSTATTVSARIISNAALVIKTFVDINAHVGTPVGTDSDPSVGGVLDLLHLVDQATVSFLMAPNALALSNSLSALINFTNTLIAGVVACNCGAMLGLTSPEASLNVIALNLNDLNALLQVPDAVISLPLIANSALRTSVAPLIDPLRSEGLELDTFVSVSLPASLGNGNIAAGLAEGLPAKSVMPSDDVALYLDASVDNLTTLVLALNSTASLYPVLTTVTLGSGKPLIDISLISSLVDATFALAHHPTDIAFVSANLNTILTRVRDAIQSLTDCQCMLDFGLSGFFEQLVEILDEASVVQGSWASFSSGSIATTDRPIVVGLTTVSNKLGLPLSGAIVVDGLLGDELDNTIDDVLNDIQIGSLGT